MTNDLMPDFSDSLDSRLRQVAEVTAEEDRAAVAGPRRVLRLAAPALVAAAVLLAVAIGTGNDGTPPAYGEPLILKAPTVANDEIVRQLQQGVSVRMTLGDGARLHTARAIPAFGGTAYLVTGDVGWCISAPDPALLDVGTGDPAREGAVTCSRLADIYRYGLYIGVGSNALVALPANATPPVLETSDGRTRELTPNDQGVVVIERAPADSVLTLFGPDGSTRSLRLG